MIRIFLVTEAVGMLVAATIDSLAGRIVVIGTAVTLLLGLARWTVKHILMPGAKIMKRVLAQADTWEHLPAALEAIKVHAEGVERQVVEHSETLAVIESEVAIAQNEIQAVRREWGISDDRVRSLPQAPVGAARARRVRPRPAS